MHFKLPLLALLASLAIQSQAVDFIATNSYLVAKDQVVDNEQWVLAAIVEADGTFKNDLFIMSGNELNLSGTYEGNIWGATSMGSTLEGRCDRNVRLTGKTIRIDGHVGGNVMAIAETVIIGTNALVQGSVKIVASTIVQEGTILGHADFSSARMMTLGGIIEGDVTATAAADLLFTRDAQLLGNLTYTANKEIFPAEGIVTGTLERVEPTVEPLFSASRLMTRAMWFFAAFLAGIPFFALFPMTTAMAAQLVRKAPWKCLLVGFIAFGALPIFGVMSISSLIGVPLGTLILASWGIMLYLSRIIMALVIGTLVLRSTGTSIRHILLTMALGLAIIYLATAIPSIGIPIQLTVIWMGMGSLILSLLEKRRLIIQAPKNLQQLEALKNETYNPEEK